MEISCIVLAGGKGLRLGCDKVLEVIAEKSLLQRVVYYLSCFNSDIIVVRGVNQTLPALGGYPRLRIVADIYPEKGPLGGVYTGLALSDSFHNLVVAGDMPFLNQALLGYMVQLSDSFDVVVPRLGDMLEPLHAVYSKDCLEPIEYLLNRSDLGIRQLFDMVRVRYVDAGEIDRFDPRHMSFFNINTEADLDKAREMARTGKSHDKC